MKRHEYTVIRLPGTVENATNLVRATLRNMGLPEMPEGLSGASIMTVLRDIVKVKISPEMLLADCALENPATLSEAMAERLGAKGWELVSTDVLHWRDGLEGWTQEFEYAMLWFKREVEEQT